MLLMFEFWEFAAEQSSEETPAETIVFMTTIILVGENERKLTVTRDQASSPRVTRKDRGWGMERILANAQTTSYRKGGAFAANVRWRARPSLPTTASSSPRTVMQILNSFRTSAGIAVGLMLWACSPWALAQSQDAAFEQWVELYGQRLPKQVADCSADKIEPVVKASEMVEQWAAYLARYDGVTDGAQILARVDRLIAAKQQVDKALEETLAMRTEFLPASGGNGGNGEGSLDKDGIRCWLKTMSNLIDLSGRLKLQLSEAVNFAAFRVAADPTLRERLVELCIRRNSDIGAAVVGLLILPPPPNAPEGVTALSEANRARILQLIASTGERSQLPRLAELIRDPQTPLNLVVQAVDTIRQVGLPQDLRPSELADKDYARPPITADEVYGLLEGVPASKLAPEMASLRQELLDWLDHRRKHGLEGDSYRLGHFDVRPGDWLLMRNPSPYNLFTDLNPGLFTHVGVAAIEVGSDGKRRMVIVDLPERGSSIPAENVENYLRDTLHFVFLRHRDEKVGAAMGARAASIIGNESSFDLNFRTDRVLDLKGKPLDGVAIKTYCAGLLLLCALETPLDREEFFPVPEGARAGNTADNIQKLGLSIGKDFISPTGTLFSPSMLIAGRVTPLYEPTREVEEMVFDHFSYGLEHKVFTPSPDLYQALRVKMAEAAEQNPLLAEALRKQENIGREMDLVTAAKTQAVVETLDDIAYGHSELFTKARFAVTCGDLANLPALGYSEDQISEFRKLREQHQDLYQRFLDRNLTPRELRVALVKYYGNRGKQQLDERFFNEKQ